MRRFFPAVSAVNNAVCLSINCGETPFQFPLALSGVASKAEASAFEASQNEESPKTVPAAISSCVRENCASIEAARNRFFGVLEVLLPTLKAHALLDAQDHSDGKAVLHFLAEVPLDEEDDETTAEIVALIDVFVTSGASVDLKNFAGATPAWCDPFYFLLPF